MPLQAPFFLVLGTGLLYWLGGRRSSGHREDEWLRSAAFYAGLLSIIVALDWPLDDLADKLFLAHMTQHLLLLMVAPPLIVLSAPWLRLWRPLPLGFRRTVAKSVARGGWAAPLRALGRLLSRPVPAWIAFNVALVAWHVPALYDLTLRNEGVHYLEHATFLVFAMLFWAQVADSPPFRSRLDDFQRVLYLTAGAVASWLLAVVLALSPTPLYSAYSSIHPRPEGLSALTDQQLAAGIMWGPGSVPFAIGVFWLLYAWLAEDGGRRRRPHRRAVATSGESR